MSGAARRRRLLFHAQSLLGIGHDRRALRLAAGLAEGGFAVTMLAGTGLADAARAAGLDAVPLPDLRAADAGFRTFLDAAGRPADEALHARRRELCLAALARIRPDILLVESWPFGRRALRGEILPLVAAARRAAPRIPVATSLRDVVVARPDPERIAATVAAVRRDIDLVLVHGDPAFLPLGASFPEADAIADRVRYTGYVTAPDAVPGGDSPAAEERGGEGRGEVLVSAGGGAVGGTLLRAALAARPLSAAAGLPWRLLGGLHLAAAEFDALAALLPAGVVLERHRSDFPTLLARCAISVSQGGYNTVVEILAARARAVVVPFAAGRETEQMQRAEALARRGVLTVVPEAELDAVTLAAALDRTLAAAPAALPLLRGGAARSATLLAALAEMTSP